MFSRGERLVKASKNRQMGDIRTCMFIYFQALDDRDDRDDIVTC